MSEYLDLITDPAHTAVELTYIMVDLLILGAVKHAIVKHLHRDLRERDRKHKHNRPTIINDRGMTLEEIMLGHTPKES
jgi:hypothetical protein